MTWVLRANLCSALRNIIEVPARSHMNPELNTTTIHLFNLLLILSDQIAVV